MEKGNNAAREYLNSEIRYLTSEFESPARGGAFAWSGTESQPKADEPPAQNRRQTKKALKEGAPGINYPYFMDE
jgi:hypothetical protein